MSDAATLLERCARLGEVSELSGRLTRRFGTDAMRRANELVGGWMAAAGLAVREDAAGNLIARREGTAAGAPALLLGSHLDTVRDAGRYDGPLGVLTALAVAERLREPLPFALELVGFADEEGVRFGTAYLGSGAMAGRFEPAWLERRDEDGVALAGLLRGDPAAAARDPAGLLGYCEVHIEQGQVLERHDLAVGVVSGITGQSHAQVRIEGVAGHAGTVPMGSRRDALAAAAEVVLAAEALARDRDGVVATIGALSVEPGARNVIPARVTLTTDVRHLDDAVRRAAAAELRDRARAIATARGVPLDWRETTDAPAVPMSPRLSDALAAAVGEGALRLPSGAGHDAAMMASITPAAMLFVRCAGGISHNPAESVAAADVAVAIDVLERFVRGL